MSLTGLSGLSGLSGLTSRTSPKQLSGLALWLDAQGSPKWQDSGRTTPAVSDSDPVRVWDDLSGNSRHASSSTDAKRPTLKLAVKGNLPALLFATDDLLATAAFTLNQPVTVFLVSRLNVDNVNSTAIDGKTTVNLMRLYRTGGSPSMWINASVGLGSVSTLANGTFGVWRLVFNGASSSLRVNGGTPVTGNAGTNNPGGVTVGGAGDDRFYWNGYIGEVAVYNRVLSDIEASAVGVGLRQKWGTG